MKSNYKRNINTQLSCVENANQSLTTHYLIYKIVNNLNNRYYIGQHQTDNINDGYTGSGKLIRQAIEKYDLSCFTKEILFDFDNFEDMNNKEIELVQLSNCFPYDPLSYNLTPGGYNNCVLFGEQNGMHGKNPFANKTKDELNKIFNDRSERNKHKSKAILEKEKQNRSNAAKLCWQNEEYKQHVSSGLQKSVTIESRLKKSKQMTGKNNPMYGKNSWDYMSEDAKIKRYQKICNNNKGKNNPAYGKKWMYDPKTNKRKYVKADEVEYYLSIGYVIGQNFKANKNKKRMYLPGTNTYGKMINENEIQKYLDLGYKFGVNPVYKK